MVEALTKHKLLNFLSRMESLRLVAFLVVVIAFFGLISHNFFSTKTLFAVLMSVASVGLVCIGQSLCLLTGGFDLSVGSVSLIAGALAAYLVKYAILPPGLALLLVLVIGAAIGLANGQLIAAARIDPLIVTLASDSIIRGASFFITKGNYISAGSQDFRFLGTFRLFGVPVLQMPILLLIFSFAICYIVVRFSRYGKHLYAVGGNSTAAFFSGVPAASVKKSVYAISGFFAAFSGFLLASRLGSAQPAFGSDFAIFSIAAAVLGGISLKGGRGTVIGAFWGVCILQVLSIGMLGVGLKPFYQYISSGAVLLLAVFVDRVRRR